MTMSDITVLLASGALVVITILLIVFLAVEFMELSARRNR